VGLGFGLQPAVESWEARGRTLHRRYLEQFLEEKQASIRGRCLEFQSDVYATRFGHERIESIDILHKDPGRQEATIVADLAADNSIPDCQFDSIICTYVLHLVSDPDRVVAELHRILRPGGTLLACVPDITVQFPEYDELWRFTAKGLKALLDRHFIDGEVSVRGYGNSLVAAGELRGLGVDDFSEEEREFQDPRYALVVCASAAKAGSGV
jgi:SAM-dependent methyltransferase